MAKTRADLVGEVARRFGHYARATATGGSTTTIVDSAVYEPDDYWTGHYVYIVTDAGGAGAAPEGEERPVTDYVLSSGTLTVGAAFSAAVASGDVYELLHVRRADVVAAINTAIRAAGETWMVCKTDTTTVTIVDDDYDYDLPADLARLLSIWYRSDSDVPWEPLHGGLWRVNGTPGGPQELLMETLLYTEAGDTLRLEYLARPEEMDADSDELGVGDPAEREFVDYLITWALFVLHDQAAAAAPEAAGFRPHLTQAQYYREMAEATRQRASRFHGPGTLRTERWARSRG